MKAPHRTITIRNERAVLVAAHIAGIIDGLIYLLSFTYYSSNYRADVLFSDWAYSMAD